MDLTVQFFIYLAALVCFVVAAVGEQWRYGSRTRRGTAPVIVLVPLGLALAVLPTVWNTAVAAW
jgi:hypothetical protein